jgi:uncharacterized protein
MFIMKINMVILLCLCGLQSYAQADAPTYESREVMITMRDGIRLNTKIWTPVNSKEPLPILFIRSPYGVSERPSPGKNPFVEDLAKDGYIFVYQDIRGRYKSEGQFEMLRNQREKTQKGSIDESTDTYDAIDWIVNNVPNNNGKVGMYGVSYNGWTSIISTIEPHPALKTVTEQATPADMWIGDDFYHNGAFRLSFGFEYSFMEEAAKTDSIFQFNIYDTYEWYLLLGPLSNVNKKFFHNSIPTWNNFIEHPDYDEFWKKQSLVSRLNVPTVPILHVGGYWDQEDCYGPQKAYAVLEGKDIYNRNYLVLGPWNHGGWMSGSGEKLGNINFGTPTGQKFRKEIQATWFNYHLKGRGDGKFPEAIIFQTGSNVWKTYTQWPPIEVISSNLYLSDSSGLKFEVPVTHEGFDSYISDPALPVPYRQRPIDATFSQNSRWHLWLTEDQRFVDRRPDVARWLTTPLMEEITVTGNVIAVLFASTSGTDSDWIVKLIDVYPDRDEEQLEMSGYQLMIASDVLRGRYRNSYEKPEPVKPGEVNKYTINLHAINHVFKKGHRIMVQIQSSWFPIIDRNPQRYIPNIFNAREEDFIKATQKIYWTQQYPSHLKLPLMNKENK